MKLTTGTSPSIRASQRIGIVLVALLALVLTSCTTSSLPSVDTTGSDGQSGQSDAIDQTSPDTSAPSDSDSFVPIDTSSEDLGSGPSDIGDAELDADPGDLPLDVAPETQIACAGADCPIVIASFPYSDKRDTKQSTRSQFGSYSCSPNTNEGGAEYVYVFQVHEPGTIIASVEDGSGVDIDIHLLTALDAQSCLARHDRALSYNVDPGVYYLVADTYVSSGTPQAGEYTLRAYFIPDTSKCGIKRESIKRIGTSELLTMPATGPVVLEAHLMTKEEHEANLLGGKTDFPSGWPTSYTDRIAEHYQLSEQLSGYKMTRKEPWAPCCEPSNEFGQGSSERPPMLAETWYVNMRWSSAPKPGTRYIAFNPFNGKAVVTAAGYENGPGDTTHIGGASEEVHNHLGTVHLAPITFGSALVQTHPYGPIDCFQP